MTVHQILEELQKVSPHIRLKLPANSQSVRRQLEEITLAQQQLANLQRRVTLLAHRKHNSSVHQLCVILARAVERMIRTAENFKLLAEEYAIDPEGTISCLQCVNQDSQKLAETIRRVKAMDLK